MRVRFISKDSDILNSISKIVNQRGTFRSVRPGKETWYGTSFNIDSSDFGAIIGFADVYGLSVFQDKESPEIFYLKPLVDFLPSIEDRIGL